MVAEHEGMRLWPRFSYVRLPHVGSHAGADDAKGAEAPICTIQTWSVQGVPLGMYAPAFLSLNKKQAKSHDILKAKRLGSID